MTFSCDTESNPALTFFWTKDGNPLNVTSNPRYSLSADKKQLTIKDVNKTDRGEYKCVVQKGANMVNSTDAAMLTVECKDNIFLPIHLPFNFTKCDVACFYVLGTCHYSSLRGWVERGKEKMQCKIRTSAWTSSGLKMLSGPIPTYRTESLHSPRNELTTSGLVDHYHLYLTTLAIFVAKVGVLIFLFITYWFQTSHHQNCNLFIQVHRITF